MREVFITGVGIVSPAGMTAQETFNGLLEGGRFVRLERNFGLFPRPYPAGRVIVEGTPSFAGASRSCHAAGSSTHPATGDNRHNARDRTQLASSLRMTDHATCDFAVRAAREAMSQAGLSSTGDNGNATQPCILIGTNKPLIDIYSVNSLKHYPNLSRVFNHFCTLTDSSLDAPARAVAADLRLPNLRMAVPVSACATGTHAIVQAARLVRDGDADLAICGGSDASIHPLWLAAYDRLGVLACADAPDAARTACRPFDRTRSGLVPGEGAGILVLESGDSVRRRRAEPIACIRGWASGSDPTGLTSLDPEGRSLAHAISLACKRAGCLPGDLGGVIAHGTGTRENDLAETRALSAAIGPATRDLPIVSFKGAIGHLLGACGAVETALTVLAAQSLRCPGTSTLTAPDPVLGPLCLPTTSFDPASPILLKTALGFGGHVAAIVIEGL
jgi:3-oxoacyl-(acyl-carrier-protein) synthase